MILVSCGGNKTDNNKTDLSELDLKGDVNFLVEGYSFTEFNENGMKKKSIYYDKSYNDVYNEKDFIYENGLLVKDILVITFPDGKQESNETLYQYQNGLLSKVYFDNGQHEYFYDKENNLIEKKITLSFEGFKPHTSIEKYFYTNKKLDYSLFTNPVGSTNENSGWKNYYNENGKVKRYETENFSWFPGQPSNVITDFAYKDNLLIKEESKSENGVSETLYSYEFDKKGNWIKKVSSTNGMENVEERQIFYKGNDYSKIISELNMTKTNFKKGFKEPQNSKNLNGSNQSSRSSTESQTFGESSNTNKSKCYHCNGTGKCAKCNQVFRKQYYKGDGVYEDRNETRPGSVMCQDCWGRGHKQKKRHFGGWEPSEDCHVGGCHDGWVVCRECNPNGNSPNLGVCQYCKGTGLY